MINALNSLIGLLLFVGAWRLRRTRPDFWIILVAAVLNMTGIYYQYPSPINYILSPFFGFLNHIFLLLSNGNAFLAPESIAGYILIIWSFFTELGKTARASYLIVGLILLIKIMILLAFGLFALGAYLI